MISFKQPYIHNFNILWTCSLFVSISIYLVLFLFSTIKKDHYFTHILRHYTSFVCWFSLSSHSFIHSYTKHLFIDDDIVCLSNWLNIFCILHFYSKLYSRNRFIIMFGFCSGSFHLVVTNRKCNHYIFLNTQTIEISILRI